MSWSLRVKSGAAARLRGAVAPRACVAAARLAGAAAAPADTTSVCRKALDIWLVIARLRLSAPPRPGL